MPKKKITVEYSVEKDLTEELHLIIAENPRLGGLREKVMIGACYLIRMDEQSVTQEGKNTVLIKKVAPEMRAFMKSAPHYVLVVDKHWWDESSLAERRGTVNSILSRIKFEETEDGIKTGLEKWDIQEMFANLKHSGVYNDKTLQLKEVMSEATSKLVTYAGKAMAPNDEPEADEPEEEKPRVVARPVAKPAPKAAPKAEPKASPLAKNKTGDEPPLRPARKIPADVEPEPEPEPGEPLD